jgi:hypothetical protein
MLTREHIEALYPRETYESEARENSHARAKVLRGLRIERASGAEGEVRIVRAARHASQTAGARNTIFLCPYMGHSYALFSLARGVHGPVVENADPFERHPEEYDAFIGRVVAAAHELAQRRTGARRSHDRPKVQPLG